MPLHPNEQPAVMAKIRRPPILRVGHQSMQVLDHRIEVKAAEFLGVIERLAHRIGQAGMLVENPKVELVRPPVAVCVGAGPARVWALAFICHGSLRSCSGAPARGSAVRMPATVVA